MSVVGGKKGVLAHVRRVGGFRLDARALPGLRACGVLRRWVLFLGDNTPRGLGRCRRRRFHLPLRLAGLGLGIEHSLVDEMSTIRSEFIVGIPDKASVGYHMIASPKIPRRLLLPESGSLR